jgi:hypothetical protein
LAKTKWATSPKVSEKVDGNILAEVVTFACGATVRLNRRGHLTKLPVVSMPVRSSDRWINTVMQRQQRNDSEITVVPGILQPLGALISPSDPELPRELP